MEKKEIKTEKAPLAIGPYSQALEYGNLIFVSGQIPIDAGTGQMVAGDIKKALNVIFANISAILAKSNSSLDNILKVTIFMRDISLFNELNTEYEKFFKTPYPAREVVEVSNLPKNAQIEVSVIAYK